ncbi:hypothetical protein ACI48D_12950 [Massilia sp. LXY-6]|uniref:hypothetical protein n=1 Tax=Massilia sp. LXY-6 TaxID=3379823 RepID=UPI003EDF7854
MYNKILLTCYFFTMSAAPKASLDPAEFYINAPLYEVVTVAEDDSVAAHALIYYQGPLDTFCPECGTHSIFHRWLQNVPNLITAWMNDRRPDVVLHCSRNASHQLSFLLKVDKEKRTIQKIGQYPSLAALNMYDVRKYSEVLEKAVFKELTKAIGLAAHGVGVGSFVYLRRIFESLVEEAHQAATNDAGWDEGEYQKGRMGEKILLLRGHLPEFLVENRAIYGILSKGVHELSEDECLKAFPAVKVGIEIILDAQIEEAARRKKLEAATKSIQALAANNR